MTSPSINPREAEKGYGHGGLHGGEGVIETACEWRTILITGVDMSDDVGGY